MNIARRGRNQREPQMNADKHGSEATADEPRNEPRQSWSDGREVRTGHILYTLDRTHPLHNLRRKQPRHTWAGGEPFALSKEDCFGRKKNVSGRVALRGSQLCGAVSQVRDQPAHGVQVGGSVRGCGRGGLTRTESGAAHANGCHGAGRGGKNPDVARATSQLGTAQDSGGSGTARTLLGLAGHEQYWGVVAAGRFESCAKTAASHAALPGPAGACPRLQSGVVGGFQGMVFMRQRAALRSADHYG